MRPLTAIAGILFGSCVAIFLGLAVVLFIYLLLGTDHPALQRELRPLGMNLAIFTLMTMVAGLSFYGLLKAKRWRYPVFALLVFCLTGVTVYYWP